MTILLKKDQLRYTACYCEENVYQLCKYIQQNYTDDLERCTVVFISNKLESFPMWRQKASQQADQLVVWDYHVVLLVKNALEGSTGRNSEKATTHVYDLDTTLPFPCTLADYIKKSFQPHITLAVDYKRFFRLIPARLFIQHFASDRSHMISQDGTYFSPPPPYPPITSPDGDTMTLPRYRKMMSTYGETDSERHKYGEVLSEELFFKMS